MNVIFAQKNYQKFNLTCGVSSSQAKHLLGTLNCLGDQDKVSGQAPIKGQNGYRTLAPPDISPH